MKSLLERRPNAVQLSLVLLGYLLAVRYGRQLPTLTPPLETIPPGGVSATLYDWSTVQLGLALVVLGLVLSNRTVLHRLRVLRLSRSQRRVALGCALALASPWIVALVAGLALDYGGPFMTLWFVAFLGAFAGAVGLLVGGIVRVVQTYVRPSDRFPYVGVDASRRRAIRGGVATLLGVGAVGTSFAAGRVHLGEPPPPYHGRAPVVYERDDLRVQAVRDPVRLGESVSFEVTNTGAEGPVALGCNVHWALQAYEDGGWHHVTWTAGRYYAMCFTGLEAGDTTTVTVPLSEAALEAEEVLGELGRGLGSGSRVGDVSVRVDRVEAVSGR